MTHCTGRGQGYVGNAPFVSAWGMHTERKFETVDGQKREWRPALILVIQYPRANLPKN